MANRSVFLALLFLALAGLACEGSLTTRSSNDAVVLPSETVAPAGVPILAISTTAALPDGQVCQATGDLHVRSGPGIDNAVIGWLRAGDAVLVFGTGDWRVVEHDGLRGYAHGKWLLCGGE